MKNLIQSFSFLFAIILFSNLFTSCKKDPVLQDTTVEQPNPTPNLNSTTTLLALAGGGGINTDSMNYCDCFALFDDVDWTVSEAEVIAQLEAILAQLTDAEVEALFTPVCTADGEVYENVCVAECNGAVNFEACDGEDLCDTYDDCESPCFDLVYPIDVLLPDGTTATANDDAELETIFEDWFFNNPTSDQEPQLVYPFDVTDEDGNVLTVNNDDEFNMLIESCEGGYHDDDGFEDCFAFVYPITAVFPDGTSTTVNNDDELYTAIENWYIANPDSNEDPTLNYPVDVVLESDSSTVTINNDTELEALIDDCYDEVYDDCFTFVFPFDIELPDGTIATANNDDEIETIIENWYNANPNSYEDPQPVFPIDVVLEDGTNQTINNMDELDALFEDCYGDMGGCFVTGSSSTAVTITAIKKKAN